MQLRAVLILSLLAFPVVSAEATDDWIDRFSHEEGFDDVQPGCITMNLTANPCHQIATSMNGLDTPKIDVLILVPVGPTAERDMRLMRQSTEMWADGLEWMARDMGMDWFADGVEFHIFAEMINTGESEFTTYPIVDPEIVIIASNPVGGIGIGIDPVDFAGLIFGEGVSEGPCHGVANPFDHSAWENLPGYNSHHEGRGGTYVEDCGGSGGNICFSVTAAIDPTGDGAPVPVAGVEFSLYDVVSHETGHCLTLGHVGDGAEGSWSAVPTNDIMAYHEDPPGKLKCVSSLNVEALAVEMSRFLDVNGDGNVTPQDQLWANDALGEFDGTGRPFQIQHPDNHYYASPTRKAIDCPQPDYSLTPLSEVVNFTGGAPARAELSITNVVSGQAVPTADLTVAGYILGDAVGDVTVYWQFMDEFLADPMNENGTAMANVTARVVDGNWSATLPFKQVPTGTEVLISAVWEGLEIIDSDRAIVEVNETVLMTQAPTGDDDRDVPALPVLGLLAAVAIAARRKL